MSPPKTRAGQMLRNQMLRFGFGAAASSSEQQQQQAPLVRVKSVPSDEQEDDDDYDSGSIITINTNDFAPAVFSHQEMQQLGLQNNNTSMQAAVWNGVDDESTTVTMTASQMFLREESDRVTQNWLEGGTQQQQQQEQNQKQHEEEPQEAMKENGRDLMVRRRSSLEGISPTGRESSSKKKTSSLPILPKTPLAWRSSSELESTPLETKDPNSPPQQPNNLELKVDPEDDYENVSARLLQLVDSEESDRTASSMHQKQQHPLSTKSSGSSTSSSSGLSELRRALAEQSSSSVDDYVASASKASASSSSNEFNDTSKIQMSAFVSKKYKKKNTNADNSTTDRVLLTTRSSGSSSSALSDYPRYKDDGSSSKRNSRGSTPKSSSSSKHPFLVSTTNKSSTSSLVFSYSSTDSISIPEPPPTVRSKTKLLAPWKEDQTHAAIFRSPKGGEQKIVKSQPVNESMKNVFAAGSSSTTRTTGTFESSSPATNNNTMPSKSSIGSSGSWTEHQMILEVQSSATEQGMEVVVDDPQLSSFKTDAAKDNDKESTLTIETKGSGKAQKSPKQHSLSHQHGNQSIAIKKPLKIVVTENGVSGLTSKFESKTNGSPMATRAATCHEELKKAAIVAKSLDQSQASPKSKEDDDGGKDPYEWAYKVWRRKGLLVNKKLSTKKSSMGQPSIVAKEPQEVSPYRKGRQSLPALSISAKTRTLDQESFSSVMSKWKAKSEATVPPVPEASQFQPDKAPVMLFPISSARQSRKADAVEEHDKPDAPSTDIVGISSKAASSELPLKPDTHEQNAAASMPVEIKEPSLSPVLKVPHSQAWKLKWGNHIGTKERKRRESMPAAVSTKKTFKTVPKSHGDYKKAVNDFLKNANEPTTTELSSHPPKPKDSKMITTAPTVPSHPDSTRSQSTTRHRRKLSDDSSVFSPFLPPPASDTQPIWKKNLDSTRSQASFAGHRRQGSNDSSFFSPCVPTPTVSVAVQNSEQKEESFEGRQPESVSRNKSDDSNSSVSAIRAQLEKESKSMRESLGSAKKPPALALDEMISPDGKRVMKNLERASISKGREDTTPREEAFSDRPWRHDRLINRVKSMTANQPQSSSSAACRCSCADSLFSGNDEMIEFFLPLTGTACTCGGKSQAGLKNANDPTSLVNILRSWQVEFLGSFGIYRGEDLVKANHRSASALARALRQYRKKMGMTPFRTKSCITALQIWSKTSKAFVRSIRHQTDVHTASNDLRAPNNLYILSSFLDNVPADGTVPSTVAVSSSPGSPFSFIEEI